MQITKEEEEEGGEEEEEEEADCLFVTMHTFIVASFNCSVWSAALIAYKLELCKFSCVYH